MKRFFISEIHHAKRFFRSIDHMARVAPPLFFSTYTGDCEMMKHLSSSDIRELHFRLVQMRTRLLDEIQAAEADIRQTHEARQGEGGSGSDISETTRIAELRRSEMEIDEQQLCAVEDAESKMSEGRYGICADCGELIVRERLFALPTAIRCTDCERLR